MTSARRSVLAEAPDQLWQISVLRSGRASEIREGPLETLATRRFRGSRRRRGISRLLGLDEVHCRRNELSGRIEDMRAGGRRPSSLMERARCASGKDGYGTKVSGFVDEGIGSSESLRH